MSSCSTVLKKILFYVTKIIVTIFNIIIIIQCSVIGFIGQLECHVKISRSKILKDKLGFLIVTDEEYIDYRQSSLHYWSQYQYDKYTGFLPFLFSDVGSLSLSRGRIYDIIKLNSSECDVIFVKKVSSFST